MTQNMVKCARRLARCHDSLRATKSRYDTVVMGVVIHRKADLDERLYRMYDRIEEAETLLIDARARKRAIEADKVRGDNIYRILTHFDKLYDVMNDSERQELMQALIAEIQIYEASLPSGQWIKSIRFRLPIIDGDTALTLDKCDGVETVVLLSRK